MINSFGDEWESSYNRNSEFWDGGFVCYWYEWTLCWSCIWQCLKNLEARASDCYHFWTIATTNKKTGEGLPSPTSTSQSVSMAKPARLVCPWNFPGKNTGVGCHFLLQGIFPTQGSNPRLLRWQADSLPLSHPLPLGWGLLNFHPASY